MRMYSSTLLVRHKPKDLKPQSIGMNMTTIVVGGHARKVGKTSVAAGIIAAFPQCRWTAVKITSHQHVEALSSAIYEETDRCGHSDTSRFLSAGAARALWVRADEEGLDPVIRKLLPAIQQDPFIIIESNRILQFIRPDLYIIVLRYDVEEFKNSARDTLNQASAIAAVNYSPSPPAWPLEIPAGIPVFPITNSIIIPNGFIDFIRYRLKFSADSPFPIPD
jgi:hypothetical protein